MDKKRAYLFCKFLHAEMKKIDEDKYFEGERRHCDPGQSFIVDWINRNAANWRGEWEKSKCQHCAFWRVCGHCVRSECVDFQFDEEEIEESSE